MKIRLENVEAQTAMLEKWQSDLSEVRESVSRIEKDTHSLRTRLDDAEDRSRRDNLIFHGLPDVAKESAEESEEKILSLFKNTLKLNIPEDRISRAHRIGQFTSEKCRPIIVKFST
ncbi:hypothetical protein HPB48_018851 [Haemaphysalis longicornis]|uniref:Uncharacterized protein n=1 Tax=Haemaphysalis longicornis TaxID=44386 RepID=A0A9J6H303_HAELO|nr:hypothetical protein HPB48_018851 [Haemaphysalis longicornis]